MEHVLSHLDIDFLNGKKFKGGFLLIPQSASTFGLSKCKAFKNLEELNDWYSKPNYGIKEKYMILPIIGKILK